MSTATKDKYDEAIEYLTAHPDEMPDAWGDTSEHKAGCLFAYLGDLGDTVCGCPTMVKNGFRSTSVLELTTAVRADPRIPRRVDDITVESLPAFADIQRLADKLIPGRA